MGSSDCETILQRLLEPGFGEKDRWAEALQYLQTDPHSYLPHSCRLADAESAPIREPAARLVSTYLAQRVSLEIDLFALRHLPFRNPALASAAVAVTERVLRDIEESDEVPPETAVAFLNNLSERLARAGSPVRALKYALLSVERFRELSATNPSMAPDFVRALNTLAKRYDDSGDQTSACNTAQEAVQAAERLPPTPSRSEIILLAQSLTLRGNRALHADRYADALADGSRSEELLKAAFVDGQDAQVDLALARLVKANASIQSGRFHEALGDAEASFRALQPIAAERPVQFWDFLLAAANAFSTALARLGESRRAKEVIESCLREFGTLAEQYPSSFAAEYVAYLITRTGALGESGDWSAAVEFAELAVAQARRFRRAIGDSAWAVEGQALNNFFLRLYDHGEFIRARNVASRSVRAFERAPKPLGLFEDEAIRALRNLAESLRMTGETPLDKRKAIRTATKATSAATERARSNQPADLQLLAQCHSSQSLCEWEVDHREAALASEARSLALRRRLFAEAPNSYRKDLAYSLRLLGTYHHELDNPLDSLRLIAESIREYRTLSGHSDEDISQYLAEALHIRCRILVGLQKAKPALRSLRGSLDLLLVAFRHQPDGVRKRIVELLPMYVNLKAHLNQEIDDDVIAWVAKERARQPGDSGSSTPGPSE